MNEPGPILLVGDNPITRELLRLPLEAQGYEIVEAETDDEAVDAASRAEPSLIIQDLVPDRESLALLGRLRELPGGVDIPILACTGFLSEEQEARLAAAGFDDWLPKPIQTSRLLQATRSYLVARPRAAPPPVAKDAPRILVVDDDPIQLKLQRAVLASHGYEIETARDGTEALEAARRVGPDAILCDVLMPGMDGLQFTSTLRVDPALAGVPVVLVTSQFVSDKDRRLALNVGAHDLVFRSSDLEEAVEALGRALESPEPPVTGADPQSVRREYVERVVAQLERQASANTRLAQQVSMQAASLAVLGAVSEAASRRADVKTALQEVLAQCVDASGLSGGAICVREDGAWRCAAQAGWAVDRADVERALERPEVLDAALRRPGPTVIHDDGGAADEPRIDPAFLERAGVTTGLIAAVSSTGETYGALILASRERRLAGPHWRAFAQTLAAQLGQGIALSRAFSRIEDDLERLRASRERIRWLTQAVDQSPASIMITDLDGTIEYVNRRFTQITGYLEEEALGATPNLLQSRETPDEVYAELWETLKSGEEWRGEIRNRRKDGELYWDSAWIAPLRNTAGEITHYLAVQEDVTERKRALDALRESEERFRQFAEHIREAFFLQDVRERRTIYVNPTWEEMFGLSAAEIHANPDAWLGAVHPEDMDRIGASYRMNLAGHPTTDQFRIVRPDGDVRWVRARAFPILEETGEVYRVVGLAEDVTEIRAAEERLQQSQRMEAVGRLAGGVAHDFNNLLTVILAEAQLTYADLDPDDPTAQSLLEIQKAGERASVLTRQLLAFSRRQVFEPTVFRLNDAVADMQNMLNRIIGEDVELVTRLAPGAGYVKADRGQVEQVLANLIVNARDAMPRGGELTIETVNVRLDEGYTETREDMEPGDFVKLTVSDTGHGMSEDVRVRVFEPFFTTKDPAKGTGLGLATSFGIVKQSGGHIAVYSEVGLGTTVTVYMPRSRQPEEAARDEGDEAPQGGSETVLVVEDESSVRRVAVRVLRAWGYQVLEAGDAEEAIDILEDDRERIDLLLTDVVLPRLSGRELMERAEVLRPGIRVLFMSGYTDDVILQHRLLEQDFELLHKPFTAESLTAKVREVLDQPEE